MRIVRLIRAVHPVLQQMQRHTERFKTKFGSKTELFETEKVFINIFGEVAANELITAILECTGSICANVFAKSRTLQLSEPVMICVV